MHQGAADTEGNDDKRSRIRGKGTSLHVSASHRFIGDVTSIHLHIKILTGISEDNVSVPLRQITGSKM